jgi:antitoxin Phd
MTNKTITATDAKNRFAELVDSSRLEPIMITRNDRPVAILVSPEEYARLMAHDDVYWAEQATKIKPADFLSAEASQEFLIDMQNARD